MPAEIIDGKRISDQIKAELALEVASLREKGIIPGLAAVLVGDNQASALYVDMKAAACKKIGMTSEVIRRDKKSTQDEILRLIEDLNRRDDIDGILVQDPLPSHIDQGAITLAIDPGKDVDGFHPLNQGLLMAGRPVFEPATPLGIIDLLCRSGHDPSGKNVVILGRGFLVGRPLSIMISSKGKCANATVTLCHTGTRDIRAYTLKADIVIVGMGKAKFLTADMVQPGAVVIDVGTNYIPDSTHPKGRRLVGDVDFEAVSKVAGAITPVPGGVGPMTISALLKNTLKACKRRHGVRLNDA